MAGGQKATGVTLRPDLKDMMDELKFEELNLQAEKIAPSVPVKTKTGDYPVMPRETKAKIPDTRRAKGGGYARGEWEWDQDTYSTREYGYEEFVDNVSALENADYLDEEKISSELAYEKLILAREARVAESIIDETYWAGSTNLEEMGADDSWWAPATAKIYDPIDSAAQKIRAKSFLGKKMMTLIITDDALEKAFRCKELMDDSKYTVYLQTMPTETKRVWLREYLGIKDVIVVSGLYDTAGLGQDAIAGRFWSNGFGFLGILSDGAKTLKNRNAIRQLVWTRYAQDYVMETYPEPGKNAMIVRAREYRGIKRNKDYGVLIKGINHAPDSTTGF